MRRPALAFLALAAATAVTVPAAIASTTPTQAGPESFTVDIRARIAADRETVYSGLLAIGAWWHPDHTFFGDPSRMSLQPRPGGCFCENQPDGRWAEHLRVVNANPGTWLRMVGALGPLQEQPVTGVMTVTLEDAESATLLRIVYRVAGHVDGGLESWAGPVENVLQQQLDRLQRYVETGSPDARDQESGS